jgi:hypothetical protein
MPIDHWGWEHSFGINNTRHLLPGMYIDHRHLIVHGKLMRPAKLAGFPISLSFVPSNVRERARHFQ